MSSDYAEEIEANIARAEESIEAANDLVTRQHYDFAASRAYYAAFYAATAILLAKGIESSKHSGIISLIHQQFVKTGRLSQEQGKNLNWLFELRSVGDYGGTAHVSSQEVERAIQVANEFVAAVKRLI